MLDSSKFEVVGEASDVDSAVDKIIDLQPDVVLLDIHLHDRSGAEVIELTHQKMQENKDSCNQVPKFLALSVSDSASDVSEAIGAGALGYITKTITQNELSTALENVAQGLTVFSPKLAGFILQAYQKKSKDPLIDDYEYNQLSNKEKEVLRYIARGYTYKEVASELFVSVKTVEAHVSNVLKKLQLSNRHEITFWANQRGIFN
jgi:DNA-binding NarL/FixJ family response regulator